MLVNIINDKIKLIIMRNYLRKVSLKDPHIIKHLILHYIMNREFLRGNLNIKFLNEWTCEVQNSLHAIVLPSK